MDDIKKLKDEIHILRERLQLLLDGKETFVDQEILVVSRMLDEMLVEYERLLEKSKL